MRRLALALALASGVVLAGCEPGDLLEIEPLLSVLDGCPWGEDPDFPDLVCNPLDATQKSKVRGVFDGDEGRWASERCSSTANRFLADESIWFGDSDQALNGSSWTFYDRDLDQFWGVDFTPVVFLTNYAEFSRVVGHEAAHASGYGWDDESYADRVSDYCTRKTSEPPWGYEV